ncbi:MAG: cyclopropane-fatty-acyl-phospholipid synthase family protein [Gammaproteobacteria bacterium]|jgi:cyclopropane-fatty-acyl-phospholipid synthase
MKQNFAVELTESGYVPDSLIRHGIRKLLRQRLDEIHASDIEKTAQHQVAFVEHMDHADIALLPQLANEQHYEVPQAFYNDVLGPYGKYSCCFWENSVDSLANAEQAGLEETCKHAAIEDGMDILELGCGWGSLTLWLASRYPNSSITAVSNSGSQGEYIRKNLAELGLENVEVITADMNDFQTDRQFDRVVSVEMFEHMRNYRELFSRINRWLTPQGKFFMHIFVHRNTPYVFEDRDNTDWMSRYFFSGGMMPSDDLPLFFQDELKIENRWRWNGTHYQKTAEAWLQNLDANREQVWPILETTYGRDFAKMWFMRWRMFFLAVSELFGYRDGNEWFVSHYLFSKRA